MVPCTEEKKEVKEEVTGGADEGDGEWSEGGDEEGGEEQDADEDGRSDDGGSDAGGSDAGGSDDGKESKDSKEGGKPRAADKVRKKPHRKAKYMRVKKKDKKQTGPLNLNNEVVNMRKEVKRVRVLIFRKLLRQVAALKKKKGSSAQVEKHHRRAERLMVEIQAMKVLTPDVVTKTALQKVLDFERVCKNPKSTMTDRAIARIASHPQFKKKIDAIKAAVKAFKAERMKEGKKEEEEEEKEKEKEEVQNTDETPAPGSPVSESELAQCPGEEDGHVAESVASTDQEEEDDLSLTEDTTVSKCDENVEKTPQSAAVVEKKGSGTKSVKPAKPKHSQVMDVVKEKPQKPQSTSINITPTVDPKPETSKTQKEEESDIESSGDEEKEYFDDSTEERFRKQSSQSEETDSENDFFMGKVCKFKKKKKKRSVEEEEQAKTTDQVQSQLDELESRFKSKAGPLRSVFCTSLSASRAGGGRGSGRGENKFRGRGKQWGSSRDFGRPSKFQSRDNREAGISGSDHRESCPEMTHSDMAGASTGRGRGGGRGRGRGRGDFALQKHPRGGGAFSHQPPQQVLHPSWEASKKRKEQQGQILAFQGKKIKFDDD